MWRCGEMRWPRINSDNSTLFSSYETKKGARYNNASYGCFCHLFYSCYLTRINIYKADC